MRYLVLGAQGMVGRAVADELERRHDLVWRHERVGADLTRQDQVERLFDRTSPDAVVLAAARVGGIGANASAQWDFGRDNTLIAALCIDAAVRRRVERLVFLGSSCIYPREAEQPIREESLLTGPLEETNRAYAAAKLTGVELCRAWSLEGGRPRFICPMPTNLYGPGDNYDRRTSHVLAALVRRFVEAEASGVERVTLWGSGEPLREFLHVEDLARAVAFLLRDPDPPLLVNVGWGCDLSISALARKVAEAVGYGGEIDWDRSMPDGTPRKLLDTSRMRELGWEPRIGLDEGIRRTVAEYRAEVRR